MWNIKSIVCLTLIMNGVNGINLFNGKYQNVNIVIQNTVAENENLIERIKQIFTSASRQLFEATRHQVYFGQINIIIPNTWSLKTEYKEIPALSELDTYITVDNGSIITPHTKRKRKKCGSPGRFIYLPENFLMEEGKTKFGYHEKVVVREWGHLRWGLWDEYGKKKNDKFYLEDGEWKPVRCSTSITGKVGTGPQCDEATSKCNTYNTRKVIDETCRFCPDESQPVSNMSSIMAFNWLDAVTTFCDKENDINVPVHQRHNSKGWSKQNVNCNSRSSWEVMREHDDFKTATTLPASTNTVPTFRLLHETVGYRVLVIDVSGSMTSVMNKLYRASAYIIQTKIPENSWLGIIWFEDIAHRKKNLTKVTSQQVRDDLVSALPQQAGGGTCIYCGIDEAINHLSDKLGDPFGSEIIMISDGFGSSLLKYSVQNAVDAGIIIHSISVTQNPDPLLLSMAVATGGRHFFLLGVRVISFASAFTEILSIAATSIASESVTLVSEQYTALSSGYVQTNFSIDTSVGKSTTVVVLPETAMHLKVDVSSPSGGVYTEESSRDTITLDLPSTSVTGQYNVTIETISSFELLVTSLPINLEVLRVSSWISPVNFTFLSGALPVIEADVTKGRFAVLNAVVIASIETWPSYPCQISLLDNGADPDDTSNDGVYASVIPAFCIRGNGRVSAKVIVIGEKGSTFVSDVFSEARFQDSGLDENENSVLQDSFQRSVVTNDILVNNYVADDVTAPGRITDVCVIDISTENTEYGESRSYFLTWTATGDDVNIGQAIKYELRTSNNNDFLETDFTDAKLLSIPSANFTPKAAGLTECIKIEINATEAYTLTAYIAIRVEDEAGNIGSVSNIISILVANSFKIEVTVADCRDITQGDDEFFLEVIKPPAGEKEKPNLLVICLSSAAAVIVLTIVILTLSLKNAKAKARVEDSELGMNDVIRQTVPKKIFESSQLQFIRQTVPKKIFEFSQLQFIRQTVPKKIFESSQLQSGDRNWTAEISAEMTARQSVPRKVFLSSLVEPFSKREQNWTALFSPKQVSNTYHEKGKPFDIVSEGSGSTELYGMESYVFNKYSLNNDTNHLYAELSSEGIDKACGEMLTEKQRMSDILPGEVRTEKLSTISISDERHDSSQTLYSKSLDAQSKADKGVKDHDNKCEFLSMISNLADEAS